MNENNKIVNGLWIGNQLSKLELLTILSFIAHGHTFRLWLYEPLSNELPEGVEVCDASQVIHPDKVFSYRYANKYGHGKGSYAGFSDIFRYKLLYEKGGWWVDMDITCLKSFDFDEPYFFRDHHELRVVGNVIKCPRHSDLMRQCYEEAIKSVDENNTDWHKPIEILNRNIVALSFEKYIHKGLSNDDKWDITRKYIVTSAKPLTQWYCIHWQNEEWRSRKISRDKFYYRSALGILMSRYSLFEPPSGFIEIVKNHLLNSGIFRVNNSISS